VDLVHHHFKIDRIPGIRIGVCDLWHMMQGRYPGAFRRENKIVVTLVATGRADHVRVVVTAPPPGTQVRRQSHGQCPGRTPSGCGTVRANTVRKVGQSAAARRSSLGSKV
jgi:hypothetical protein